MAREELKFTELHFLRELLREDEDVVKLLDSKFSLKLQNKEMLTLESVVREVFTNQYYFKKNVLQILQKRLGLPLRDKDLNRLFVGGEDKEELAISGIRQREEEVISKTCAMIRKSLKNNKLIEIISKQAEEIDKKSTLPHQRLIVEALKEEIEEYRLSNKNFISQYISKIFAKIINAFSFLRVFSSKASSETKAKEMNESSSKRSELDKIYDTPLKSFERENIKELFAEFNNIPMEYLLSEQDITLSGLVKSFYKPGIKERFDKKVETTNFWAVNFLFKVSSSKKCGKEELNALCDMLYANMKLKEKSLSLPEEMVEKAKEGKEESLLLSEEMVEQAKEVKEEFIEKGEDVLSISERQVLEKTLNKVGVSIESIDNGFLTREKVTPREVAQTLVEWQEKTGNVIDMDKAQATKITFLYFMASYINPIYYGNRNQRIGMIEDAIQTVNLVEKNQDSELTKEDDSTKHQDKDSDEKEKDNQHVTKLLAGRVRSNSLEGDGPRL